jgi:hypothetical protein
LNWNKLIAKCGLLIVLLGSQSAFFSSLPLAIHKFHQLYHHQGEKANWEKITLTTAEFQACKIRGKSEMIHQGRFYEIRELHSNNSQVTVLVERDAQENDLLDQSMFFNQTQASAKNPFRWASHWLLFFHFYTPRIVIRFLFDFQVHHWTRLTENVLEAILRIDSPPPK